MLGGATPSYRMTNLVYISIFRTRNFLITEFASAQSENNVSFPGLDQQIENELNFHNTANFEIRIVSFNVRTYLFTQGV